MTDKFSDRHGYRSDAKKITVREDAPRSLRAAIPHLAIRRSMSFSALRSIICEILLVQPDPDNWSEIPNVRDEVNYLINDCDWFKVYDIAESIHRHLLNERLHGDADDFQEDLNQFFLEKGIGWKMYDGEIEYRGSEEFAQTTSETVQLLKDTGQTTAANEIKEALGDISRRPEPDTTGAIQHVMAALECTARNVTGKTNQTLGQLIADLDLPRPLDEAIHKLWGFASNNARHLNEGATPTTKEAALVVSVACAVCTFLSETDDY